MIQWIYFMFRFATITLLQGIYIPAENNARQSAASHGMKCSIYFAFRFATVIRVHFKLSK